MAWLDNSDFLQPHVEKVSHDFCLHADFEGFGYPATLFKPSQQNIRSTRPQQNTLSHLARPDIESRDELTVIELTFPYETNFLKSRKSKVSFLLPSRLPN